MHECIGGLPLSGHGEAIEDCTENEAGELWAGNSEYGSQVNFCPYCGYEAKVKVVAAKGQHPLAAKEYADRAARKAERKKVPVLPEPNLMEWADANKKLLAAMKSDGRIELAAV